ncbi:TolC family protein [uncultured Deinococcus sp.]|uniref:TolC family protein n=1 Tax=uncultured Deinococcus sp. TaxID=158789 RepID=UPI00258EE1B4|nr:TolC family protein [uncultured Deinococcus sp.]
MSTRCLPFLLAGLLSAAFPGGSVAAQAAPTAAPTPLTREAGAAAPLTSLNAVLAQLRQSPGWRAADLNYRAAQLSLDSARARAGLSLSVGGNAALVRVPWDSGAWQGTGTVTASVGLSVLPWSPALEGVRSAERALGAAAAELRSARASLTLQAAQAYAGARSAAQALALADTGLALNTRLLEAAQAQRAQNLIPEERLLQSRGALAQAQAAQAQAARGVQSAAQGLARVLGGPVTLPGTAAEYAPLPTLGDGTAAEAALLARAATARPEIARALAGLADAQAGLVAAQRDATLPDLTAAVQAGQLSDAQGNAGRLVSGSLNLKTGVLGAQVSLPLRDPGEIPNGLALSLSGTFPLLGSGRPQAAAQAQLGAQQATLALENARLGVELEVRTRLADLRNARGGLSALQLAREGAAVALGSARARLDAGLGTGLDVAQAELNLAQAEQALDRAAQDVALSALALAQATGELDPALLGSLPPTLPLSAPTTPTPTTPAESGARP